MHDYILVVFAVLFYFVVSTFYTLFIAPIIQVALMEGFLEAFNDEADKTDFDDHVSTAPDMQS